MAHKKRERQTSAPEAGWAGGQLAGKQLCRKGLGAPVRPKAEQEPAACPQSTGLPPCPPALLGHPSAHPTWAGLPGAGLPGESPPKEVRKGAPDRQVGSSENRECPAWRAEGSGGPHQ